jgi:hypothetical protein
MTVDVFSIPDFVDYLHKIGIHPDLIVIEKYGNVYILDKQAIALYHTGAITFDNQWQVSPFRAGSPHYVGFHEDGFIKPSKAGLFSNPRRGGNTQDPQGGTPVLKGGKGVIRGANT